MDSLASFTPPSTTGELEPAYAPGDPDTKPLEQAYVSSLTINETATYSPSEAFFEAEDYAVLE